MENNVKNNMKIHFKSPGLKGKREKTWEAKGVNAVSGFCCSLNRKSQGRVGHIERGAAYVSIREMYLENKIPVKRE
jgi:hypothetical protein